MAEIKWSESQLNIFNDKSERMIVSASAGTGKTTVMLERLLRIMLDKNIPISERATLDNIVLLAFNKSVARELRDKLVDKFIDILKIENDPNEQEFIKEQINKVQNGNISTIDAYCRKVLLQYSYLIDHISSNFDINNEESQNIIKEVIKDELDSNKYSLLFDEFLLAMKTYSDRINLLYGLIEKIRTTSDYNDWLDNVALSSIVSESKAIKAEDTKVWKEYFKSLLCELTQNKNVHLSIKDSFNEEVEKLGYDVEMSDWATIYKEGLENIINKEESDISKLKAYLEGKIEIKNLRLELGADGLKFNYTNYFKSVDKKGLLEEELFLNNRIRNVIEDIVLSDLAMFNKKFYFGFGNKKKILERYNDYYDEEHIKVLKELISFIKRVLWLSEEKKKEKQIFDFIDIQYYAKQLIQTEEVKNENELMIKYIFVDEYQDINPLQDSIIEILAEKANLFIVGDIKQSIYSFRDADPQIFLDKIETYSNRDNAAVHKLNQNFRSLPAILNHVNDLMSISMTKYFGGTNYKDDAKFVLSDNARLNPKGVIKHALMDKDTNEDIKEKKFDVSAYIYDEINKRKKDVSNLKNSDFALLYRQKWLSGKNINNYNEGLQEVIANLNEIGVPSIASFDDGNNAKDLLAPLFDIFRLATNPNKNQPLFELVSFGAIDLKFNDLIALRQYARDKKHSNKISYYNLMGEYVKDHHNDVSNRIIEFKSFITKIQNMSKIYTVSEITKYIKNNHDPIKRQSKLIKGYINQFESYVKRLEYNSTLRRFILNIDKIDLSPIKGVPNSEDAMEITTVHRSKGLEWDTVFYILPTSSEGGGSPDYSFNIRLGLSINYFDKGLKVIRGSVIKTMFDRINNKKEDEENLRLLYVALTRAKNKLFIIFNKKAKGEDFSALGKNLYTNCLKRLLNLEIESEEIDHKKASKYIKQLFTYENEDIGLYEELLKKKNEFIYDNEDATKQLIVNTVTKINKDLGGKNYKIEEDTNETNLVIDDDEELNNKQFSQNRITGIYYHEILEKISFNDSKEKIIDLALKIADKYPDLSPDTSLEPIFDFLNNEHIKKISQADVYKEKEVVMYVPTNEIYKKSKITDKIIIRGKIDLLSIGADNKNYIVDYKFSDQEDAQIIKTYKKQLELYAIAIEEALKIKIDEVGIFVIGSRKNNYKGRYLRVKI